MFESFFPKPRLFFLSFAIWSIACVAFWFSLAREAGESFSLGGWFGYEVPPEPPEWKEPPELAEDADESARAARAALQREQEAARAAHEAAAQGAGTFWLYQYMILCYAFFLTFWYRYSPHKWARWSVFGSAAIIFVTWFQVQLDVMINGGSGPSTTSSSRPSRSRTACRSGSTSASCSRSRRSPSSRSPSRWSPASSSATTSSAGGPR